MDMFKVRKKKDGQIYQVYSVQTVLGQGPLGQPTPVVLFLIYNAEKGRWELTEAAEFEPEDAPQVEIPKKSAILGV